MQRLALALVTILALTLSLWGGGAARAADDALTPAQSQAVERLIEKYLDAHPEAVGKALQKLQEHEQAMTDGERGAAIKAKADELFHDPADLVEGDPHGDVTVVEFFDYRCPYCKRLSPTLDQALAADGHIRLVLKELPILGPMSLAAARAAIAAKKQDKYAPLHHALLANRTELDDQAILDIAAKVGVDTKRLAADMNDPQIGDLIKKNLALAEALKIEGTPALIIGDKLVPGAVDAATFAQLVKDARGKS